MPEQSVTVHTAESRPKWRVRARQAFSSYLLHCHPWVRRSTAIWAENFSKDPPPNLRKELMVPILAYRMQEREFGGLSHGARRRLREVAASLKDGQTVARETRFCPSNRHETSARVAWRNARGHRHRKWLSNISGQTYSSLSEIAREITGTRWSGPAFFGMKKRATGVRHERTCSLCYLYPQILRRRARPVI